MKMPVMGLLTCLLMLSTGSGAVWAENQTETRSQGQSCAGDSQELGLDPIPGGFLELPAKVRHIRFARDIAICAQDGAVTVTAAQVARFSCADIRDSPDAGVGVNFLTSDGTPHHLWLHINADAPSGAGPQVLEIGLYRNDTEIYWIVTKIAICAE